jgi:large subunit ribosomal protein L15
MMLGTQMGRHGFVQPNSCDVPVVNVEELDSKAGQDGGIELGNTKVLGRGRVTKKLIVSAAGFSAVAKSKIEAAGGQAVVL